MTARSSAEPADLPRAYVINLAGAADRRAVMTERLGAAGVPFSFFPAVDGRAQPVEGQPIYDGPGRRAKVGHDMIGGEIGCLLSHKAVLGAVAREGRGPALVFEDDVLLDPYFADAVRALMARQDLWELVRFLGSPKIMRQAQRPIAALGGGFWLTRFMTQPGGAHAYLVSEAGARKLLARLERTPFPIDNLMGRPWRTGVASLTVRPGLARQDEAMDSNIGDARFVSAKRVRDHAGLGRRLSLGAHRMGDNFATRAAYFAGAPGDWIRRWSGGGAND